MSEFLFIIPSGWTQLPIGIIDLIPSGISAVQGWVDQGNATELTNALRDAGQLPANQYIIEAKLFNGDMLVVRIGTD